VDDGSVDKTGEILSRYGDKIKVIRKNNSGSRGIGRNRNIAAAAGSGEWIAFLDHDDSWEPGKLIAQILLAEVYAADIVYTNVNNIGAADRVDATAYGSKALPSGDVYRLLLNDNFIFTSSVMVRRSAFQSIGGFDETGTVVEDWDLWLRMAESGSRFFGAQEALTNYTWRDNSVSKRHLEASDLRRQTIRRALQFNKSRYLSWHEIRRIRANVEATNAWFVMNSDPKLAITWYGMALLYWPFSLKYIKGLIKSVIYRG
jgi:glycosyltransferase involved in cell wall biosynthesis